ncbi:MAG: hypothetical protein QOH79_2603 [Acidimicrobiaceae bacterium]
MRKAKRFRILTITALSLAAFAVPAVAASAAPPPTTDCTTAISDTTIAGDLRVPNNMTCHLKNVNVTGSVTVNPGASLYSRLNTFIHGSLTSNASRFIQANNTTFGGPVKISKLHTGKKEARNGICNSDLKSDLRISDNDPRSDFVVGDEPPDEFCNGGNKIAGSVWLQSNHASTQLANNEIAGTVYVVNNTQTDTEEIEFDIGGNSITGNLNCSGNNPAPDTSEPNTVNGSSNGQCAVV